MNDSKLKNKAAGFREHLSTVIASVLVAGVLAGLVLLRWQQSNQRVQIGDYEGSIVDRWGDYSESREVLGLVCVWPSNPRTANGSLSESIRASMTRPESACA
jgi:hypothetical protein